MRIVVVAVGRLRRGPERQLIDGYAKRLGWDYREHEVAPARERGLEARLGREASLLRQGVPAGAVRIALDSAGTTLDSEAFARRLEGWLEAGRRDLAFLIGGADGLDAELKAEADFRLSFGAMTWPHLLARVLLAEQLYRAQSILSGHPYHHAGAP